MTFTRLLVVTAAVAMFFAITLGLFAGQFLGAMGSSPGARMLWLMRFVGAMAFGIALLAWRGRNITDPEAKRAFSLSACGGSSAAFVVFLSAMLSSPANPAGWVLVVLAAGFSLAYGYAIGAKRRTV